MTKVRRRFTDEQEARIREEYAAGGVSQTRLASRHGTSRTAVRCILNPKYRDQAAAYARRVYHADAEYARLALKARRVRDAGAYAVADRARVRAWKAANPDKCRASVRRNRASERARLRAWRAAHPEKERAISQRRRARMYAASGRGFATEADFMLACEAWGWACPYCRCDEGEVTLDHIVPLSRGGSHHVYNLVPCCKACNSSKGAKLLSEWRPELDVYVSDRAQEIAYDIGPARRIGYGKP
jgi:5-methylcytosine-specific restriction endonuclease McrA